MSPTEKPPSSIGEFKECMKAWPLEDQKEFLAALAQTLQHMISAHTYRGSVAIEEEKKSALFSFAKVLNLIDRHFPSSARSHVLNVICHVLDIKPTMLVQANSQMFKRDSHGQIAIRALHQLIVDDLDALTKTKAHEATKDGIKQQSLPILQMLFDVFRRKPKKK